MSVAIPFVERPSPDIGGDFRRCSGRNSYPPICVDASGFLISRKHFDALPVYTCSRPTGVYDGKCWKEKRRDVWFVGCFIEEDPPHPDGLLTLITQALVVEPLSDEAKRNG